MPSGFSPCVSAHLLTGGGVSTTLTTTQKEEPTAMTDEEVQAQITQLQQQQHAMTRALKAAVEGRWVGEADSVEGWLVSLDPGLSGNIQSNPPSYA